MARLNCGIIATLLLLVLSGQSEAHRNYPHGVRVIERKVEYELTNDCGICAYVLIFYRKHHKYGIFKTPKICYNGPRRRPCKMRRRRNIRALTKNESNYSTNEGNSNEVTQIDVLHESESSSRGLQTNPEVGSSVYVHISDYQGDVCFIGDDEQYHPSVVNAAKLKTVVFCQKMMKDNITPVNVSPVTYLLHGAGVDFTGNGITISTSDGTYCRLAYHHRNGRGDGRWRIVCDLTNDVGAEKFNVAKLGNGQFSIQDSTGSYCEMGWGIRCRFRRSVTAWGRFGITAYTTNNGVGCADSSKSLNPNKNLRMLQGPIGTPCTDTWWDDFITKFGIGELGGVDGKGPRPNIDRNCWFSKEENRGYISLLEWGTPNQTKGCNPGWNKPGCGAYQMADILTKNLSIKSTVSAVDWWGPTSAFGSDDCPAVAAEINRIMSKIPHVPYFSTRWEEVTLNEDECRDVVFLNEKNNNDGGVKRPITIVEFYPQHISSINFHKVCRDSTIADRETIILTACKNLLSPHNNHNTITYFRDKTGAEADVYSPMPKSAIYTVCNNPYELVTTGDCMPPDLVDNRNECKNAFKDVFDVENVHVEQWNTPSYAKGCFKHNWGGNGRTRLVYNRNGGPGTSGHCTGEPSYAACVCRAPQWIMTYGVGLWKNMKQNSRLWEEGGKFIKSNGHWDNPVFFIRRLCDDCATSHQEIIYKRLTPVPPSMDVKDLFLANWFRDNNILGKDFELYSSFGDAMSNNNKWKYCNYNDYGIGFPRDCGPVSGIGGQWNSLKRGGKSSVAYYVWYKNHAM